MKTNSESKIIIAVDGLNSRAAADKLTEFIKAIPGLSDVDIDYHHGYVGFAALGTGKTSSLINHVTSEIRRAGYTIPTHQEELDIYNMRCAGCVATIENGLKKIPGIADVAINFAAQTGRVELIDGLYDRGRLLDDIHKLGYDAGFHDDHVAHNDTALASARDLWISVICAALISILHMGAMTFHLFTMPHLPMALAQLALTLPVLYAGRHIFDDAFLQLRHLRTNMNSLIAVGSGVAFIYSSVLTMRMSLGLAHEAGIYFETSALIITFILIGRFLEARATREARDAAAGMASLIPQTAFRLSPSGVEEEIPVSDIAIGNTIILRPGRSIPADGVVADGETVVDESLLTGEAVPVTKKAGDNLIGGTVNISGAVRFIVTQAGKGTVLARMIRMVQEAQGKKAPIQRLADRVAGLFVPIVIAIALVTLAVWAFVSPGSAMVLTAPVAVLLVACPCALGLATPTAILVGTGRAARLGILFRDGEVLERMNAVNCVVFDKTGTLTVGRPVVERILPADGVSTDALLKAAASAEQYSEHLFAAAIRERASADGISLLPATDHFFKPGMGVIANFDGRVVIVGNRRIFDNARTPIDGLDKLTSTEKEMQATTVYVASDNQYMGAIVISDTIRDDAPELISRLHQEGFETIMLTGDNRFSAAAVANKLGITRIESEALPEKKLEIIQSLRQSGFVVAMVGDGVNDAAALAAADIGVAMGSGADIAIKASDITITGGSLATLTTAFTIARATFRVIKQNLFWAFIYNIIMIPVAAGILYPVFGWSFSPVLAAVAMAFSSVFVVTNSLRLRAISSG
jgi:P-type Cu+ transporter